MSTILPVDPNDERVIQAARHHEALRYIETHEQLHLDEHQLVLACATHLVATQRVADRHQAHAIAMAAFAEYEARTQPAWVDISLSTAFVVRVVDPVSGQVACFTAAELVRIAHERAERRGQSPTDNHFFRRAVPALS